MADSVEKKERDWSWFHDSEIELSLQSCGELFRTEFWKNGVSDVIRRATITLLLIQLSDLLQKANSEGHRVAFTDDIDARSNEPDVTSLITNARNAACHVTSGFHKMDSSKLKYLMVRGNYPAAFQSEGETYGCDFADDVAFFFGIKRVYVQRHLMRALFEVETYFRARLAQAREEELARFIDMHEAAKNAGSPDQ